MIDAFPKTIDESFGCGSHSSRSISEKGVDLRCKKSGSMIDAVDFFVLSLGQSHSQTLQCDLLSSTYCF